MSSLIGPRVAALCSAAFALFLFLGVASIDVPRSVTDQELVDWWSKGGNQTAAIASMYFVVVAAIAFVVFLTHIRERLNADGGTAGNAMFAVGLGVFAMLLGTAAVRGVIGSALKMNDEPLPGVDTLRYLPQLQYAFMNIALIAAGTCLLLAFWAMTRTAALPAWFAWASAVAGILILAGTPVVGPLTLPVIWVWALAGSVAVWRSPVADSPGYKRESLPA